MEDAASRGPESMPEQTSSVCLSQPDAIFLPGSSASLPRWPFFLQILFYSVLTVLHTLCQLIKSDFYFKMFLISFELFSILSYPTGYCLTTSLFLFFPTSNHIFSIPDPLIKLHLKRVFLYFDLIRQMVLMLLNDILIYWLIFLVRSNQLDFYNSNIFFLFVCF